VHVIIVELLTTREAAWSITLVVSVCQMITFERLDIGSSYLHISYISREYGSCSYLKVMGSRSRSQEQKSRTFQFPRCKTVIGLNSGSVKHKSHEVCM